MKKVLPVKKSWLVLALVLLSCEKGNPVLDEGVILLITASPNTILNFGDTSVITVQALEADGRPVLDGSRIQFTASGGSISSEVRTVDGLAQTVFTSDASTGTFTIAAQSGSLGGDGSVALQIEVIDRNVEVSVAQLSLNPSNLSKAGGQVSVRLVILGPDGEPIPGKSVVFSSDYGTLGNNGAAVTTDDRGLAHDTLFLSGLPEGLTEVNVTASMSRVSETRKVTITPNANPTPVIVISPDQPNEGENVFFNGATSTDTDGTIVKFEWNLGDGVVAGGPQVSHVYRSAKQYVVTLSATDDQGAVASTSRALTIGANQVPTADFSYSPEGPRVNDVVFFDARESFDPDGQIVAYQWSMGNGSFREGPTAMFAFSGAKTYNVLLTVTDNSGGSATAARQVSVSGNRLPVADFVFAPISLRVDDVVTFDASLSADEDGHIAEYEWNFGDALISKGEIVTHIYRQPGRYEVLLKVTDNDGGSGFFTDLVEVNDNLAPQAAFNFSPSEPKIGQPVAFDASQSSDSDGTLASYQWDFGDNGFGSGRTVQHNYHAPGSYTVALTVRDDEGKTDTVTKLVTVDRGGVPVPVLRVDPASLPVPGGSVVLDGSGSSDAEDGLNDLIFEFEAAAPAGAQVYIPTGHSPVRQATLSDLEVGDRVVFTMSVRDGDGNQAAVTDSVEVSAGPVNEKPSAVLSLSPADLQVPGGLVTLDGSGSSDPDGDLGDLRFDFSAQTAGNVDVTIGGDGPIRTATVGKGQVGDNVTFRLTVTDLLGAQNTTFKLLRLTATPSNTAPTAVLTRNPSGDIAAAPTIALTLDAGGSSDPEDGLTGISFDFSASATNEAIAVAIDPSGGAPFAAVATVTGAQPGDQVIFTLTVTDQGGLIDQTVNFLRIGPPAVP